MHERQIEELLLWRHLWSCDVTNINSPIKTRTYTTKYDVRSIVRTSTRYSFLRSPKQFNSALVRNSYLYQKQRHTAMDLLI